MLIVNIYLLSIDEENIMQFINAFVHAYNNNNANYLFILCFSIYIYTCIYMYLYIMLNIIIEDIEWVEIIKIKKIHSNYYVYLKYGLVITS